MRKSALAIGLLASAAASPVMANDDVKKAIADPNNWAMQQGNYEGWRYSRLDQINTSNVKDLKVAWQFSTGVLRGHEGSPIGDRQGSVPALGIPEQGLQAQPREPR